MLKLLAILPFLAYANGFIVCAPNTCQLVRCAAVDATSCPNGQVINGGGFCGCCDACVSMLVCPPNICAVVDCAAVDATKCNGDVVQGGGYCGCCDACVVTLGEGDSCVASFLLGVPSSAKCDVGLHCDLHTSTCVKTVVRKDVSGPCAVRKAEVDARLLASQQQGMPLLGLESPNCDADGNYAGKQVSGSQAYCVTKDGTAISGYMVNRWEADGMNCQCARDLHNYMESGLIGKLFHCDNKGNYANLQCTGSVCYCVDDKGLQLGTTTVDIAHMDKLNC